MQERITFDFPADSMHIIHIRDTVKQVCDEMGFSERDVSLVTTAVWEAVLNAVTHGSPHKDQDRVQTEMIAEDSTLYVNITSCNIAFELPATRPNFNPTSTRGRGLPIIYAVMDEVSLTRSTNCITLHLVRRLNAPGERDEIICAE